MGEAQRDARRREAARGLDRQAAAICIFIVRSATEQRTARRWTVLPTVPSLKFVCSDNLSAALALSGRERPLCLPSLTPKRDHVNSVEMRGYSSKGFWRSRKMVHSWRNFSEWGLGCRDSGVIVAGSASIEKICYA